MVRPNAASAPIQPSSPPSSAPVRFGDGQTGSSEIVNARGRTRRLTSGPADSPGIGTNAITPDTRASTSRKPYRVARLKVSSVCIPGKIAEQQRCVGNQFRRHPRQQQQQAEQERQQFRHGTEAGVLNGSQYLHEADHDSNRESDRENRQSQPKGLEQCLTEDLNGQLGSHVR